MPEREVIFRDRQELQAADLNSAETFTDEALQHLITDAITAERQVIGLVATASTVTELSISAGRLWAGGEGKVYRLDGTLKLSLFGYLPISDKRWLGVGALGQEVETDVQPRDFLIDLQTGQTEPRAVAMERLRQVVVQITAGVESPEPQKPLLPTGHTLIAYVQLGPAGILAIEDNSAVRLKRLFNVNQRLEGVEGWQGVAQPRLATLGSDIAALSNNLEQLRQGTFVRRIHELASDVARLRELANLPSAYAAYSSDRFIDASLSNTAATGYSARIDVGGLSFPWVETASSQLQLLNPLEAAVHPALRDLGHYLPAYTEAPRLQLTNVTGELAIAQYQYQTHELKQGSNWVTFLRYGPLLRKDINWWNQARSLEADLTAVLGVGLDVQEQNADWVTFQYYYHFGIDVPYQYQAPVTQQVSGSQLAQTFLVAQHAWLTRVDLIFTARDASGIVYLALCETQAGLPDPSRTIALTQVDAAALRTTPEATTFRFQTPAFLEAGKRYAVVLTTAGNHKVATVAGADHTQGTIFYSLDGAYFQGDLAKDLAMTMYHAQFNETRAAVDLAPVSLLGGIAEIALQAKAYAPKTTELLFEYQVAGRWYPIAGTIAPALSSLPALVPMRLTFVGSSSLMPLISSVGSALSVKRPAASFTHVSTARTLAAATGSVEVQVLMAGFDATKHTCTITILVGTTSVAATTVTDASEGSGIRRTATFTIAPAATSYAIKIAGTTTEILSPFSVTERIDIAF